MTEDACSDKTSVVGREGEWFFDRRGLLCKLPGNEPDVVDPDALRGTNSGARAERVNRDDFGVLLTSLERVEGRDFPKLAGYFGFDLPKAKNLEVVGGV